MIDHLWQSTWFGIAAWVMTLGFRGNRAWVRYWLWFSASREMVAKSGPKLKAFEEGSCVTMPMMTAPLPVPALPAGQKYCRVMVGRRFVNAEGSTVGEFSKLLNLALDRPTVDRTGILGRFHLHVEFSPDEATPRLPGIPSGGTDDPAGAPSIFTAMQEQLGLKLVPAKGPAEFRVVDHVERPSEN